MTDTASPDHDVAGLVRASFARQGLMGLLGAELVRVEPGEVRIELPFHAGLTQQHGLFHAGATTTIVDSACGYAALTTMPPGSDVLTVEFKINLLAPALGDRLVARGRVLRAGRTITVCQGDAYAVSDGAQVQVATMTATMIRIDTRAEGEGSTSVSVRETVGGGSTAAGSGSC